MWPWPGRAKKLPTNAAHQVAAAAGGFTRRSSLQTVAGLVVGATAAGGAAQGAEAQSGGRVRIASLTDGREDESARLAQAFASLRDGATLELVGRWSIGRRVELAGRRDVSILGDGAMIVLHAGAWTDKAAIVLRDCVRSRIEGLVFDCNGTAFVAGGWGESAPTALAVISTARDGNTADKTSRDIVVACTFLDMAERGLGVRLVDGVRIASRFRNRARGATSFCDIARSDNVDIVPDSDSARPATVLGGSDYVVSPGTFFVGQDDVDFRFEGAINWIGATHYEKPFEARAPSGAPRWTIDFSGGDGTLPATYDHAGTEWFFTCIDDAGAEDVQPEQIRVVRVDGAGRSVEVELTDLDGKTPRPFRGQSFRITGLDTARFCRSIRVRDGAMRNSPGAGILLLGCDGITVAGVTTRDCFDYGIDLEWSINATITGNSIRNRIKTNGGIGVLFFFQNIVVANNVIVQDKPNDAAISAFGTGQANRNLIVSDNMITGGAVRLGQNDTAYFTGEAISVTGNRIADATVAIFVRGSPRSKACAKTVTIRGGQLSGIGQQPIVLQSVSDVHIADLDVRGTLYRCLVNIEGGPGINARIHIEGCTFRGAGYNWAGLPVVQYQGTARDAPAITQERNVLLDGDLAIGAKRVFYQAKDGTAITTGIRSAIR